MKWFGESWGAPVCDPQNHTETPVGGSCAGLCGDTIREHDKGLVLPFVGHPTLTELNYHLQCFMESLGLPCPTS